MCFSNHQQQHFQSIYQRISGSVGSSNHST
jgi:hypothetical protein